MPKPSRFVIAFKALRQLGLQPVALNVLYRMGLATGHYRLVTYGGPQTIDHYPTSMVCRPIFDFPSREQLLQVIGQDGLRTLLVDADEIAAGKVRLFGADPVDLQLTIPGPLAHWTAYETGKTDLRPLTFDIKLLWEPARFGWAFTLGRAYHLSGDEKYAEVFWRYFETFTDSNPPCLGPHWMSAQEVSLRLMAFIWAAQVFGTATASTPDRKARLAASVIAHAARIPPTHIYARSQQNNHLLTEAAGLFTAGLALPEHPEAARWCALGWKWLNRGLQEQIDGYGEYAQHSTNYHRLMLQLVLWVDALIRGNDLSRSYRWPRQTAEAITRATHWLLALLDADTGWTPNLVANDGAYIFPFTISPFADYRPVAHAAARAFLNYDLPGGPWDEMSLWFGVQAAGPKRLALPRYLGGQLYGKESWAYLQTAQFTSRPSHADQLHLDLWWRGLNVAQDAGTYLYNADPPWDNRLTVARVHNTVTVDGHDQFTRAGRFLYLDGFNAYRTSVIEADPFVLQCVSGRYRASGIRHTRTVMAFTDGRWIITDELLPLRMLWNRRPRLYRLHWLLPDWEWDVENRESRVELIIRSPHGIVRLCLYTEPLFSNLYSFITVVRAGKYRFGSGAPDPTRGWVSPTYGIKNPALSLAVEIQSANEVKFTSEFIFP